MDLAELGFAYHSNDAEAEDKLTEMMAVKRFRWQFGSRDVWLEVGQRFTTNRPKFFIQSGRAKKAPNPKRKSK